MASFAVDPPEDQVFFVTQLWDRHFPEWREREKLSPADEALISSVVLEKFKEFRKGVRVSGDDVKINPNETESWMKQSLTRKRKGSWQIA